MKTKSIFQHKNILCGLSAVAILGSASCTYTDPQPHDGYTDRTPQSHTVTREDYVYYPAHNVYYNRGADNFRVYEENRWVNLPTPRNVSRQRVLSSESVSIEKYGSPERHYTEYVQPNLTSGNQSMRRVRTSSSPDQASTTRSRTTSSRTVQY